MQTRRVLVPLLVVALAAGLYFWPGFGETPIVDLSNDVNDCGTNLRRIYAGLVEQTRRLGDPPPHSGIAALGALIADGTLEDTPTNRASLTCPGPNASPVPPDVDYASFEALTTADSAYAMRDFRAFPLAKFPSGGRELEPIAACDNANGLNHDGCMNVLYSDGSVKTLTLAQEIERGHLQPGATTMTVGKGSTIPGLEKLVGD